MRKHLSPKPKLGIAIVLVLLGAASIFVLHLLTFENPNVHYHANFALYVNGQRDEFKSFTYYEEIAACSVNNKMDPKARAHMHDQNNGLVHVHADGVTWGYFFANLGYTLGDKVLQTNDGTFVDGQDGHKLSFILNGQPTGAIADRIIGSEDRLLINYGNDDQKTLEQRYSTVPTDAHKANTEQDPAACSGTTKVTAWERIKQALVN